MRVAISGTACQGKSTLIKDFLDVYKMYETPEKTYRDVIVDDTHSKNTSIQRQWEILDFMADQLPDYRSGDNIILDRCPLDNIVYSLWAHSKGIDGFDKTFIDKCIPLVRESMKFIDIIFFIPITKAAPVDIEPGSQRETDAEYIAEIDNIFKAMYQQWLSPESEFFPADDKPAIIEIFGSPIERMHMIQLYLDTDNGDSIDEQGLLDINEMEKIEAQFRNTGEGYTDTKDINNLII